MSGGGSNTISQNTVPEWLQPYLTNTLASAQELQQGGGPQYYPGQTVAGLTPLQDYGLESVMNVANSPNASQVAQQQNMNIESGAYLNPSTNPYLSGTLTTAEQGVQNPITSEFGAAGRNVLASAPVQSSAMNQLANQIYGGAYNTGMQQMVQASGLAPSIDAGTYAPAQTELAAGDLVQQQNQSLINAQMNKWNYTQQLPENMLSWYSGLIGQNAAPFGGSTSSSSGLNNPALTYAGLGIGALGAGASLYSALTAAAPAAAESDARFKKDKERIGQTPSGLPLYLFRYNDEPRTSSRHVGLLAQDVEKQVPGAVYRDANGMKYVDYSRLGLGGLMSPA